MEATSGAFSRGSTTSRIPCSRAAITLLSTPRTGTSEPSRASSPISSVSSSRGITDCRMAARMLTAMDRSKAAPSLRTSAGLRFTVVLPWGIRNPLFRMALWTRCMLSLTAASGSPTMIIWNRPPLTSVSTVTGIPSTPTSA